MTRDFQISKLLTSITEHTLLYFSVRHCSLEYFLTLNLSSQLNVQRMVGHLAELLIVIPLPGRALDWETQKGT